MSQSVKNKYQTMREEVKKHWVICVLNIKVGWKERGRAWRMVLKKKKEKKRGREEKRREERRREVLIGRSVCDSTGVGSLVVTGLVECAGVHCYT